jgi:predicted aminopeptidase
MASVSRVLTVVLLCAAISACAVPFYWQAVKGQLDLFRRSVPIDTILADPTQDTHLKNALRNVVAIRAFAAEELGLPDNKSYRSYADLGRPYVVWNVVATREFSIDPERWCFPFVGCVAYRGFFDARAAERFAGRLGARGFDVTVVGATAYSTLGYFADPVLNTMLDSGEEYVAAVLFHELAHQKLYIKGDAEFSEAFATAVEEFGTERWLERAGDTGALTRYRHRMRRRAEFAELVLGQQERLRSIFASSLPAKAKTAAKQEAFATMRVEYEVLKRSWEGQGDYDTWFARPLNNADLAAVATYRRWVPGLRWQLEQAGLENFYREVDGLAALSADERHAELETWLDTALSDQRSAAVSTTVADNLALPGTSERLSPSTSP